MEDKTVLEWVFRKEFVFQSLHTAVRKLQFLLGFKNLDFQYLPDFSTAYKLSVTAV